MDSGGSHTGEATIYAPMDVGLPADGIDVCGIVRLRVHEAVARVHGGPQRRAPAQEVAHAYHAACTPDFFLFGPQRTLEIDDAQGGTEIPMRLRLEVERAPLAPGAHDDAPGGGRVGRARPQRQSDRPVAASEVEQVATNTVSQLSAGQIGTAFADTVLDGIVA